VLPHACLSIPGQPGADVCGGVQGANPGQHARLVHAPDKLRGRQAQQQVCARQLHVVDCRGSGLQSQHPVYPLVGAGGEGVGHRVCPVVKDWGHLCTDYHKHPPPPLEGVFNHIQEGGPNNAADAKCSGQC
jgi:hypothetical protein